MLWLPFVRRDRRRAGCGPAGVHGRPARLPRRRRGARGARARRRRRRRRSAARRSSSSAPLRRLPGAARASTRGCAGAASRAAAAGAGGGYLALLVAIGIGLHNLGEGLAIGSAYAVRRARARRLPGRRLRDPQHHRGPGDRRAARATERPSLARLVGARADRRSAGDRSAPGSARPPSTRASPRFLFGVGVGAIAQVIVQLVARGARQRRPRPARRRGRRDARRRRRHVR